MWFPRGLKRYDKLGYKYLLRGLKYYLLGSASYRMTKRRAEAFFEDDDRFDLSRPY